MTEELITDLGAVRIFVSDLERAVEFHRDRLGLEARDAGAFAVFRLPGAPLLAERVDRGEAEFEELVGQFAAVSLKTPSVSAAVERLSGTGVVFEGPPERQAWGGTLVHFRDPDDNVLTLVGERRRCAP